MPHRIRYLGIANVNLDNLELLYDLMDIKPAVVQNRFSPSTSFDRGLRRFCVAKGIVYQAFGTLTRNPLLLESEPVRLLAGAMAIQKQMALYCLILGLKNIPDKIPKFPRMSPRSGSISSTPRSSRICSAVSRASEPSSTRPACHMYVPISDRM